MLLVQIIRIPAEGVSAIRIDRALMPNPGGKLERRLRSADGRIEVHMLSFPSRQALDAYRAHRTRVEHMPLLTESGAKAELLELADIESAQFSTLGLQTTHYELRTPLTST